MASTQNRTPDAGFLSFKELFYLCISHWHWFVISLVICMGVALYKIVTTEPSYTRTADVYIKMSYQKTSDFGLLQELEGFNYKGSFINEIGIFKSRDLMTKVASRLKLDMNYSVDDRFRRATIYGSSLPVEVVMADIPENKSASLTLDLASDGKVELTDFVSGDMLSSETVKGALGDTITTPLGRVAVLPSPFYVAGDELEIYVNKSPVLSAGARYAGKLAVEQQDEYSDILTLTVTDVSIKRADDILNTLIDVYNEEWIKDKNQNTINTNIFINERLGLIEQELGNVESDISSYKSQNLMSDVETATSLSLAQVSAANEAIKELNDQIYMAEYIRNYITNEANKFQVLPANAGLSNTSISGQISAYNQELLERNSLVSHSSTSNPLVIEMDASLDALRQALVRSIDNELVALNTQVQTQKSTRGQATSQIASSPNQARYLLSVERQQKVKESLYLFLLQKREENELSQAFTAYSTRVINAPGGSTAPTAPVKSNILLVAFAIGLLIPIVLIFLLESTVSVVRGRKDLDGMSIPFVGEIPLAYERKKLPFSRKKQDTPAFVAVRANHRDVINEAFRVVRANLEFMLGNEQHSHVVMVTSINVSSGKTFTCYNLAASLAIKGKRVLAIDLDLRKASLSAYINSPNKGISDLLAGSVSDVDDIICRTQEGAQFDFIPVGKLAPNPSELLYSEKLTEMLAKLRQQYDYIFLDCPPVEVVADSSIINKHADLTLFVVRAYLLEKEMIPEIDSFYTQNKYKRLALLLNGTSSKSGRHKYRYGYGYGNYKYGTPEKKK